jgi:hypothetical protein
VEAAHVVDRLRLLDRLGEADIVRFHRLGQQLAVFQFTGVAAEDLAGAGGQRRIDQDRAGLDRAAAHQLDEVGQQFLGALDGKGRDEQRAVRIGCHAHFRFQRMAPGPLVDDLAIGVAIGALADHIVEVLRCLRIILEEFVARADIAGEHQPQHLLARFDLHFDRGRAEQVAGIPEAEAQARHRLLPALERHRAHHRHRTGGIRRIVDRFDGVAAAALVAAVELVDFAFLDMRRIRQHHRTQVDGSPRGEDRPVETGLGELGQQPGMVDMRMGQNDRINVRSDEGKLPVVQFLLAFRALEHAAIDQHLRRAEIDEKTRPRHRTGGAMETEDGMAGHGAGPELSEAVGMRGVLNRAAFAGGWLD